MAHREKAVGGAHPRKLWDERKKYNLGIRIKTDLIFGIRRKNFK